MFDDVLSRGIVSRDIISRDIISRDITSRDIKLKSHVIGLLHKPLSITLLLIRSSHNLVKGVDWEKVFQTPKITNWLSR